MRRSTIAVVGLALLAGCTSEPGGFGLPPATTASPDGGSPASASTPAPARDVRVSAPGFRFEPATVVVARGESIVLVFHNPDSRVHTLTINELSLQMTANPGETVRLPVQASSEGGTFVMFCSIQGHLEAGHRGRFEIS